VEAVKEGTANATDAATDLEGVSATFATILRYVGTDKHAQTMLLGILALLLTYYGIICANQGSAQAHADAQAQLEATRKIDAQLQSLSAHVAGLEGAQQKTQSFPAQRLDTKRPPNRHERRKAAALARRKPS
jgi:hypothetical protein